jgi:hypothetical protein
MDFLKTWMTSSHFSKIGFDDVKYALKYPELFVIINTLSLDLQENIIKGTVPARMEETILNRIIEGYKTTSVKIIVYGRNTTDESAEKKATHLLSLGFTDVFLYNGGIFEWFLLQEIYGHSEFPTTENLNKGGTVDLLKYRPEKQFDIPYLGF